MSFESASLGYFHATGHDLPKHVTPETIAAFLTSEIKRYAGQPGTAGRLLTALTEADHA